MDGKKTYHVLGLMSGSSLDGLDIAHCKFEFENDKISWRILQAATLPFEDKWKIRLKALPEQSALDFYKTHTYFGHYMGELTNRFLEENQISPDFIASHGHTIYHYPNKLLTCQIGDGAALACKTGLPVICDFRSHDIALKGEGTPLAPTADRFLFPEYDFLLNLGGIANLTYQGNRKRVAFDVTPCNQVLNFLANLKGVPYDENGNMASQGKLLPELYDFLNKYPFYYLPPPKSLDNRQLGSEFLSKVLSYEAGVEDKLHTCCHVFASQISQSILNYHTDNINSKILVSGGGTYNTFLISCLEYYLEGKIQLIIPNKEIIEFKEALLMALMGLLRVLNSVNCFSEITGAMSDSIGGAIYQGLNKQI